MPLQRRCARIFRNGASLAYREATRERVQALKNSLQYTCQALDFPQNVQRYGL